MANLIEILLKSNSGQVTTELGKVDKALDKTGKQAKTSGGMFDGLGSSIVNMAASYLTLRAAAEVMSFVIDSAAEAEAVQAQLNAVLQSTDQAAGMTADALNDLADELSKLTGVDDELILKQEAVMLTFTKISKDIFPKAIEAALNMSAALGQDLQSSVIQLGKALNDPISGVTALRRVGVMLTEEQENQIKAFVEQNDLLSAQKMVLGELATEFGGAAEAMGSTFTGSLNKAKISVGNLAEAIGGELIPALEDLFNFKFIPFIDELTDNIKTWGAFKDAIEAGIITEEMALEITYGMIDGIETNAEKMEWLTIVEEIYANKVASSSDVGTSRRMMLDDTTESMEALEDQEAKLAEQEQILKETMDELSTVMSGRLGAEMDNYADKLVNIDDKLKDTQETIDEHIEKIGELNDELRGEDDKDARKRIKEQIEDEKEKVAELRGEYSELEDSIKDVAEEHAIATRKIIFDILQQQLAMDGLTQAEADALVSVAGKWGLIDQETQDAWNAIADYIKSLEGTSVTAEGVEDAINNINGGEPMVEFKTQVDEAESALGDAETAGLNMGDEMVKAGDKSEKSIEGVINKVDTLQEKLDRLSSGTYSINLQTTKPTTTTVYDFDPYYDLLGAQGVENFVVPPGYSEPYNPFTVGLSSGEQLNVTPAGESGGGGGIYVTVNVQQVANDIDVERAAYRIASVIYDKQHGD